MVIKVLLYCPLFITLSNILYLIKILLIKIRTGLWKVRINLDNNGCLRIGKNFTDVSREEETEILAIS